MEWFGKKTPPGMVAMPALDWMWTETAVALRDLQLPPGSKVAVAHGASAVAFKRNQLVGYFLDARPRLEWLLFLDADMVFPASTVRHLLRWNVDVVSASAVYKRSPHERVVTWLGDEADRLPGDLPGLAEVAGVGAACLMIRRRVVEEFVTRPWFEANAEDVQEDVDFCRKVRAAGLKVHVDTRFPVGHIGPHAFVPEDGEMAQVADAIRQGRKDGIRSLTINV